jgi:hypothetical protein
LPAEPDLQKANSHENACKHVEDKYMSKLLFLLTLFTVSISALAQSGKIMGKLTYPGDYIPTDMVLCVKNASLYAEPTLCSNDRAARLREARISFKLNCRLASYEVSLPAGTYYLHAFTSEMPGMKAYYDEFVRCGMNINCKSKRPVAVKVKPGQVVRGITVGDFWD